MQPINFFIFLYRLVENLILGKESEKKVSEISGYFGFAGSPIFRKKIIFSFFSKTMIF